MEKYQVLQEKENPLFKRREIKVLIGSFVTPSFKDAEKLLSEKFSSQEESIAVKRISGKFGAKSFLIKANIYDSKEQKEKTEPKKRDKKSGEKK